MFWMPLALPALLVPQPTLRSRAMLVPQPTLRSRADAPARAAPARCSIATSPASLVLVADAVQDTLLDIGVYGLLGGTAALTLYSIYVTLDESNKKAGGWTKPSTEKDFSAIDSEYNRKNMIYDPASNQWRSKSAAEIQASSDASGGGGMGGGDGGGGGEGNRYEKRMRKKQKQKEKRR